MNLPVIEGLGGKPRISRSLTLQRLHQGSIAYPLALGGVVLVTIVCTLLDLQTSVNALMVYLLWVIYCASKMGPGPSILAAVLSVFSFDFFFVEPFGKLTLGLHEASHSLTLAFVLAVALLTARWTSQIRELGEARLELLEEARTAELLKEKERLQSALLNSISHDLQTPISCIVGALDGLADSSLDLGAREKTSLLETARQETHRLKHLVSNLLDLTRLESGPNLKLTTCDPIDLVGSALSPLELVFPDREIQVNVDPDAPPVRVDFVLIVQALINLVENALKYSDGRVWIDLRAADGESVFEIGDEGPGIPEEDREKVFEKFFRLGDTDKVGSGLGLAISKGLVEAHGGTLEALARPQGGAILKLTLPKRNND